MKKIGILFSILTLLFSCDLEKQNNNEAKSVTYQENMPILENLTDFTMMGLRLNNTREQIFDETEMMIWLQDQTNMRISWDLYPKDSWNEKKNLVISTGNLPDAFHGQGSFTSAEVIKLGNSGDFIELDTLIENYAPNIKSKISDEYKAFTKSTDGNIYALSAIQDYGYDSLNASIINKSWLDKLNLAVPKTTSEFEAVLEAFKTGDPNENGEADEIPWTFLYIEKPYVREVKREHYWIFPAFGIQDNPTHITITDDGSVIFTAVEDEWKNTIAYLSNLYSKGLIDPEVFSQDRAKLVNKVRNIENIGVYADYRLRNSIAGPAIESDYAYMLPLTGPDGDKGWMRASIGFNSGSFAITESASDPISLIKWADFINNDEISVQMTFGMFKESGYSASEALVPSSTYGKWDVNSGLKPESVAISKWPMSAPISVAFSMLTNYVTDKYLSLKDSYIAKQESCDTYRDYLSEYPYNYPYKFTEQETAELEEIEEDLLHYIYATEANWIVNGFNDSDWEDFKSQLKTLKYEKYLELHQRAFNRD